MVGYMAKLFSWDPWVELEGMQEDLFRMVEDVVRLTPLASSSARRVQYRPVADVIEQEEGFVILVELPGVEREDISLEIHGKKIFVYGQRSFPINSTSVSFHTLEGAYGPFERQFVLPTIINASAVKAKFKAGLLMILVSKVPVASSRKTIVVNVDE